MVAAEEGKLSEALRWLNKAIVGETAEILCREAIHYSFFDKEKANDALQRCLVNNPHHPRGHYLRSIDFKQQGMYQDAINAYEIAIAHYPATDHFHLNETHNNLGSVFYEMGNHLKAKSAWKTAYFTCHLIKLLVITSKNVSIAIHRAK